MSMWASVGSTQRGRWAVRACGVTLASALVLMPAAMLAAPTAEAAGPGGGSAELTATSPPDFGTVPVGQMSEEDVTVTNTGTTDVSIDASHTTNENGSVDFFIGSADSSSSCLDENSSGATISPGESCTLAEFFLPTRFAAMSATQLVAYGTGHTFALNLRGTGGAGYYVAGSSGEVSTFGTATEDVQSSGMRMNSKVVGMTGDSTDGGMWLVGSDGGVFSFGQARFHGSTGGIRLNRPVVGMSSSEDGGGYWLVASDGGVFSFGDATFHGSTGGVRLDEPIVGMATTPDGGGYWLVASDGGVFSFGDATFYGSTGGIRLSDPVVDMAASPTGHGYWLVASDGGIFSFGDVPFEGSMTSSGRTDVIGMAPTTEHLSGAFLASVNG